MGETNAKRKIHWKDWDSLCVSKLDGGLGFRDFEAFNLALIAKQWWRLIHNENSLCFKVLKAKYFPSLSATEASLTSKNSWLWRSLLEGKRLSSKGPYGE